MNKEQLNKAALISLGITFAIGMWMMAYALMHHILTYAMM